MHKGVGDSQFRRDSGCSSSLCSIDISIQIESSLPHTIEDSSQASRSQRRILRVTPLIKLRVKERGRLQAFASDFGRRRDPIFLIALLSGNGGVFTGCSGLLNRAIDEIYNLSIQTYQWRHSATFPLSLSSLCLQSRALLQGFQAMTEAKTNKTKVRTNVLDIYL
jgi:hypothetical protein